MLYSAATAISFWLTLGVQPDSDVQRRLDEVVTGGVRRPWLTR
jgi:hypothetical protein